MRLRALEGAPLADELVARTVVATAHAIAERTGVTLLGVAHDDASLTVTLDTDRLAGLGFMAEVRRLTNAWYAGKTGADPNAPSLWGDRPDEDEQSPW